MLTSLPPIAPPDPCIRFLRHRLDGTLTSRQADRQTSVRRQTLSWIVEGVSRGSYCVPLPQVDTSGEDNLASPRASLEVGMES